MKLEIFIDKEKTEQVLIYAHKKTPLIEAIEQLINENQEIFLGIKDRETVRLNISEIYCFTVEENKIYAYTKYEKYQLKTRLYKVEERLGEDFVKINQSCIANIRKIERFDANYAGTLKVIFKNGHTDYVSRRNLRKVKERIGLYE